MSECDHICRVCGEHETGSWIDKRAQWMERQQLCFSCSVWEETLPRRDDPHIVRVKGTQYVIGEERDNGGFRGYGGARWNIEFFDGRRVTSTNLWCNGDIPPHYRDQLPDNASFVPC